MTVDGVDPADPGRCSAGYRVRFDEAGPDGLLAYSALAEGRRVDYLSTPAYTLLDGRGQPTFFGPLSTTDLKIVFADGRVLSEGPGGVVSVGRP